MDKQYSLKAVCMFKKKRRRRKKEKKGKEGERITHSKLLTVTGK